MSSNTDEPRDMRKCNLV